MMLVRLSVLFAGVLAVDCVAQSIAQTSSASVMENITRFHKGCHSGADLKGGDCVAAAHRFCESRSKNSFGLLVQRVGSNVQVACAQRAWYGDVPYGELSAEHPECRGAADAAGPNCAAAVRRYCSNSRSLPGGLVQEIGPSSVGVACVAATRQRDVDYATLNRFARGCRQPGDSVSLNCTTAAAKWCNAENADDSGMVLEVGPRSLGVLCMPAQTAIIAIVPPE